MSTWSISLRPICTLFVFTILHGMEWCSPEQAVIVADEVPAKPATQQSPANEPRLIKLQLAPARPAAAALQYPLLPPFLETTPGNAALVYYRAMLPLHRLAFSESIQQITDWLNLPLKDMPRDEIQQFLEKYQGVLKDIDSAARHESCDWELPTRGTEAFDATFEGTSQVRSLALLLALRARLHMRDGNFSNVIYSLQSGYALVRHVSEPPFIVCGFAGLACLHLMNDRVLEMTQLPGSPSLFWPLAALPRPFLDAHPAIQWEGSIPYLLFPFLKDAESTQRSSEEWRLLLDSMLRKLANLNLPPETKAETPEWQKPFDVPLLEISMFPSARQHLLDLGYSAEKIRTMPVAQVIAIYSADTYNQLRDELFKWYQVPYWQARGPLNEVRKLWSGPGPQTELIPLAGLLLPHVKQVHHLYNVPARSLAELQTIEALRLYATEHSGNFPEKLSDISETPVPPDPLTGREFEYKRQGETAFLELPREGLEFAISEKRIELTFRAGPAIPLRNPMSRPEPARVRVADVPAPETAAKPQPIEEPKLIKLQLSPVQPAAAALQFPLLPPFLETTPGNAVPLYYRAILGMIRPTQTETDQKIASWLDKPLAEMPLPEAQEILGRYRRVLSDVDAAARRERCDWDLPTRGTDVISVLIGDMQQTPFLARLVALQVRVRMLEGKSEEAVYALQSGYALARHVSQASFLVCGMFGVVIANVMNDRVQELAQLPGSPSLFWPLAALPRPLFDLHMTIQLETAMPFQMFPFLRDAETAQRSAEEWRRLLDAMVQELVDFNESDTKPESTPWRKRFEPAVLELSKFPEARQHLLDKGYPAEKIDNMPVAQAISIYSADTYRKVCDESLKWFEVPCWQAGTGPHEAEKRLADPENRPEIIPLAKSLLPAMGPANLARTRLARRFAELQTIEALRLYATSHAGKFPEQLSDLTATPLPPDPFTNRDFNYRLEGETAILELPVPEGLSLKLFGKRFELTFRKPAADAANATLQK